MSLHCFSAGAHYDPSNISFGPLIGVDEHLVAPGAGFARHVHRGVVIVSWVMEGTLRHESPGAPPLAVAPGDLLVQHAGSGIEHAETNWSDTAPMRFVQITLAGGDAEPGGAADETATAQFRAAPVALAGATFDIVRPEVATVLSDACHVFVASGSVRLEGHGLGPGDSVRIRRQRASVVGSAELLVVSIDPASMVDL